MDIRDKKSLDKIIKNYDGIFHEAALTSVPESFKKPKEYHDVNVIGTKNIFEIANRENIRVVYASSSSIYGNTTQIPIKESDMKNPINPYAETKLKKEELAIKYSKMGIAVIGLRYFNVFGKNQSKEYAGVLKLFIEKVQAELAPKINGDGNQSRDFVYVEDVVNANIMSMKSQIKHEFFNVGTNSSITILDLAKTIIKISGLNIEPTFGPALNGDVMRTVADISLIKQKLGWEPKVMLTDWIGDYLFKKKLNEL